MRRTPAWSQLRRGLTAAAFAAAVALLIFFLDLLGYWAEYRYQIWVHAESARNLTTGSPVWLAGVPVGRVWSIQFRGPETSVEQRIAIEVRLRRSVQPLVTEGATVRLIPAGTLGETVVNITPAGKDAPPVPAGSAILAAAPIDVPELAARFQAARALLPQVSDRLAALKARAEQAPHVSALVGGADGGPLGSLYRELRAGRAELERRDGSLARISADPELWADLARSLRRLGEISRATAEGDGTLARLARDTVLGRALESAAARAAAVRDRLERGDGTAGRLMYDRELWIQWETTFQAIRRWELWADSVRRGRLPEERPRRTRRRFISGPSSFVGSRPSITNATSSPDFAVCADTTTWVTCRAVSAIATSTSRPSSLETTRVRIFSPGVRSAWVAALRNSVFVL